MPPRGGDVLGSDLNSYPERVVLYLAKQPELDRFALRAVIKANRLLGLALGLRLATLREAPEPLQKAFADDALHPSLFEERASILAGRWDKIPDKRRPQYTRHQRCHILRFKHLLALSREDTAQLFRVSAGTIARWELEAEPRPQVETTTSLVQPTPPLRRYADVLREAVHSLAVLGFGGSKRIAQTLARAGWRLSRRSVQRILKEKPPRGPKAVTAPVLGRVLRAKRPKHIFMADLTQVPALFFRQTLRRLGIRQRPTVYRRHEVAEAEPAVPGWRMPVDDLFED